MPRPTPSGWAFIGLVGVLYLGALQSETSLIFLLIGLLLGCLLANAWASRQAVKALWIQPPHPISAFEGGKLTEPWHIQNQSRHAAGFCSVEGPQGPLLRIGLVPAQGTLAQTPDTAPQKRGVYKFNQLLLVSTYPLGLIQSQKKLSVQGEITVYPKVYPCDPPPAAGFEPMVGGHFAGSKKSRSGTHFTGIRPLQPEDPLRSIHWKSSAKGQGLMTREYEEELSGRVALFVGGPDVQHLDAATRAAASLLFAALDRGHHVEMVDLATLAHLTIPPFSDGTQALELLARLQPSETLQNLEAAISLVSQKASLCFVLTAWPSETHWPNRRLAFYLPQGATCPEGLPIHFYTEESLKAL